MRVKSSAKNKVAARNMIKTDYLATEYVDLYLSGQRLEIFGLVKHTVSFISFVAHRKPREMK
jgi:hypothetical protein